MRNDLKREIIEYLVDALNGWLEKDPIGCEAVFRTRFMVLKEGLPIPTTFATLIGEDFAEVGFVGLLNGLFGNSEVIAIKYDNGRLVGFDMWDSEKGGFRDDKGEEGGGQEPPNTQKVPEGYELCSDGKIRQDGVPGTSGYNSFGD